MEKFNIYYDLYFVMAHCTICGKYTDICYHCGETVCEAPYCKFHYEQQASSMGLID